MNKLPTWLPTAEQIESATLEDFRSWVSDAKTQLPKRGEMRDPLSKLRERVSRILKSDDSEEAKEREILHAIQRYEDLCQRFSNDNGNEI